MSPLINLIRSEFLKLFTRRHVWVMIGILILMTFLFAVSTRQFNIQTNQSIWGLVANHISLLFWVNIFTVIVAGGIVANEYHWGTIKLLLIRPASRSKILLAKFLTLALFGLLLMFLLWISALVSNAVLFGFKNAGNGLLFGKQSSRELLFNSFGGVLLLYLLKYVEVLIFGTFALMLSVISKSNALTIGVTFFTMLFGPEVTHLFDSKAWVKYIIFPNLDLTRYLGNSPGPYPGMDLFFSIAVLISYWLIFNAISWLIFTKRDVLN